MDDHDRSFRSRSRHREQNAFYHALYHLVTHWAAYVATLGLLGSFGMLLSTTAVRPSGISLYASVATVGLVLLGSWYILHRMSAFGDHVNQALPFDYIEKTSPMLAPPRNLLAGAVLTLVLSVWDWFLLFYPPGITTIGQSTGVRMQSSDWFRLGTFVLVSLGVLYVAARANGVRRDATAAKLSSQDAAKSAEQAHSIVKSITHPVQPAVDLSSPRVLYPVAAEHYISGNAMVWTYLYYYLVGATVLALAWSTVFVGKAGDNSRDFILVALAVAGMILSGICLCLLRRSYSYREPLRDAALKLEMIIRQGPALAPDGTFDVARRHRASLGWGFGSTHVVIHAIPLLYFVVFLALFLEVLRPRACESVELMVGSWPCTWD